MHSKKSILQPFSLASQFSRAKIIKSWILNNAKEKFADKCFKEQCRLSYQSNKRRTFINNALIGEILFALIID